MAGLLDWLTEGLSGGGMGGETGMGASGMDAMTPPPTPPVPMGMKDSPLMAPAPPPGMPPVQGLDNAGPSQPQGFGDAPPLPPGAGAPPPPIPTPRPPDLGPGGQPPMPPSGPMTPGEGQNIVNSYEKAGGTAFAPPDDKNPLLRSLGSPAGPGGPGGMDQNKMRGVMGAIGAGLTAAGNSAGKSPFQALTSGAGAGLEGGQKGQDKGYDQRIKSLQLAVSATAQGDKAAANKNYAEYLSAKLKHDTDKMSGGGKNGAWNKPDSQKYIDAQRSVSQDPQVDAANKMLVKMDPSDPGFPKAKAEFDALVEKKQQQTYAVMQLSPQTIAAMNGNPPGTPKNPHVIMNKQDFDTYVKPGQAYKNPADGKIYVRKGTGQGKDTEAPAEQASSPPAPPPPGSVPGTAAEQTDPALEPAE